MDVNMTWFGPLAQLAEQLTLNQPVTGSSPVRLTSKLARAADFPKTSTNVAQSCKQPSEHSLNCQSKEFELTTLSSNNTIQTDESCVLHQK
jgi:hypothetical protein